MESAEDASAGLMGGCSARSRSPTQARSWGVSDKGVSSANRAASEGSAGPRGVSGRARTVGGPQGGGKRGSEIVELSRTVVIYGPRLLDNKVQDRSSSAS